MTATVVEIATTEAAESTSHSANMELIWLDPKAIQAGRNIRPVDLDPDFVGSIRERGVLEPVTVVGDEFSGYSLVFGFHRHAAAIEAERALIPAIVRNDISTTAAKIIDQLTENIHRTEMRPSDIAAAYDQLALEGLDVEEIARQVSQDKQKVAASLRLHQMPKEARDAADAGQLDLEQSMQIAEFENEPKVYNRLLKVIKDGGHLKYALETERRRKKNREAKAKAKAELLLAGVTVIPKPSWGSVPLNLRDMRDEAGDTYTEETHAKCPGHAAYLDETGHITYVCREPKKYGHQILGYYKHLSDEERAEKEAAEAREAERKEALAAAAQVRREHVTEMARANKTPKGLYKAVVTHLFGHGLTSSVETARIHDVFTLLGASPAKDVTLEEAMRRRVERTPEHKLPLVLFAQLAVYAEANMRRVEYGRWGLNLDFAIEWLELLTRYGYTLTDPEEGLIAELRQRREERDNPAPAAEDEWDEYDEYEEEEEIEADPEEDEPEQVHPADSDTQPAPDAEHGITADEAEGGQDEPGQDVDSSLEGGPSDHEAEASLSLAA